MGSPLHRGQWDRTMTATEDLFTPIHKAIRSMIYDIGGRLQAVDFADRAASTAVLNDMEHEADEEAHVFGPVQQFEPELIPTLIAEHHEINRKLAALTRMSHELAAAGSAPERVELGRRLNREANEFFAYYLAHMNTEEARLVPSMREHFTDDQMRALRGAIMGAMPKERLGSVLRWMLPSLTLDELAGVLGGMKKGAPPELFQYVAGVGAAHVDPARWAAARSRVGF